MIQNKRYTALLLGLFQVPGAIHEAVTWIIFSLLTMLVDKYY